MKIVKKEYTGYLIAILSVIASGIISWYFYSESQQFREPSYYIDPYPSAIYSPEGKAELPFKVIAEDGNQINKNIYLSTHYFWNKGKKAILQTDVLEDITITIPNRDIKILNISIGKTSRSVVACNLSGFNANSHTFKLKYKVLEEGDGCEINLIYAGKFRPKYIVTGAIIGADTIDIYPQPTENTNWLQYRVYRLFGVVFLFILFMLFSITFGSQLFFRHIIRNVSLALLSALVFILIYGVFLSPHIVTVSDELPNINTWTLASVASAR